MAIRRARRNGRASANWLAAGLPAAAFGFLAGPAAAFPLFDYITLDDGTTGTFLTGIRGDNIVGNIVIPGGTGGVLYRSDTGEWLPFPVETANGSNFPGSVSSSPYGPSFGSPGGILRVVGSYKVEGSSFDLSYLYDAAAAPGKTLLDLVYPDPDTEFTIAHSTFGNTVVGNWDTGPLTGNAFIYDIPTGAFRTNNKPGAISTTAYGVWGDKVAGGFGNFGPDGEPGFEHGYIYDTRTDTWTTYDHPGAFFTHFEGITGAGRKNEYNLVSDWIDADGLHGAVLHVDANGVETWIPIEVPGAITTSANSIYQGTVVGIYTDADGIHGYQVTIPGIYNPIRNTTVVVENTPGATAISARSGDDVVNDGIIRAAGIGSTGVSSKTYSVVTNYGKVLATGDGAAAVNLHGEFGSLLNAGTVRAAPGAAAVLSNGEGTLVVNQGVIDGRVAILAGPHARFENDGWLGDSAAGAGIRHKLSGTFAQTSNGVLALRFDGSAHDSLVVDGAARLDGTVAARFANIDELRRHYTILTGDEVTGTFDGVSATGLPSFFDTTLDYTATRVILDVRADLANAAGLSRNQQAVGGAFDATLNGGGGAPQSMSRALLETPDDDVPTVLDALSGELYASEQSVLVNDALFTREALLGRLRGLSPAPAPAIQPLGYFESPILAAVPADPKTRAVWVEGLGSWGNIDGDGNASAVDSNFGGLLAGFDGRVGDVWTLGFAAGYTQSHTSIDDLASTADVETGLIAGYAGADLGAWKLRLGGTLGANFIDASRAIGVLGADDSVSASYRAATGQVFAEAGYGMQVGGISVEPFAGLAWVHVHTDGFTEDGGLGALEASSATTDVGTSSLGIRFATDFAVGDGMVLTPRLSIAWQGAFGDLSPTAALAFAGTTGGTFTVTGAPLAANAALVKAGADLAIGRSAKLGLSYFGELASDTSYNSVEGTFRWAF